MRANIPFTPDSRPSRQDSSGAQSQAYTRQRLRVGLRRTLGEPRFPRCGLPCRWFHMRGVALAGSSPGPSMGLANGAASTAALLWLHGTRHGWRNHRSLNEAYRSRCEVRPLCLSTPCVCLLALSVYSASAVCLLRLLSLRRAWRRRGRQADPHNRAHAQHLCRDSRGLANASWGQGQG